MSTRPPSRRPTRRATWSPTADTAAVDVVDPSIEIQKTPDLTAARSGDTVTFTITVTNTGDVAVTNVVVTDPLTSSCDATFASLGAGAIETYTLRHHRNG